MVGVVKILYVSLVALPKYALGILGTLYHVKSLALAVCAKCAKIKFGMRRLMTKYLIKVKTPEGWVTVDDYESKPTALVLAEDLRVEFPNWKVKVVKGKRDD